MGDMISRQAALDAFKQYEIWRETVCLNGYCNNGERMKDE